MMNSVSPPETVPEIAADDDPDVGERHAVFVAAEAEGMRLDKYLTDALADKVAGLSRSRLRSLIGAGRVGETGEDGPTPIFDASRKVKAGERYMVEIPTPEPAEPAAQEIPLDVRYEDADLIVISKPAGLVVHPAPGSPDATLVNALLAYCGDTLSGVGGEKRPGIVHRLDKETSGLMVVAKTDRAHQGLADQFAAHGRDGRLSRAYTAFAWGTPRTSKGRLVTRIDRSPFNRRKMAVVKSGGREAITHFEVVRRFGDGGVVSQIECRLETGRTHQIRVHLTHMGHPLLGDPVYGGGQQTRKSQLTPHARAALEQMDRQALHAHHLGFVHPASGETLQFDDPLPADMSLLAERLSQMGGKG